MIEGVAYVIARLFKAAITKKFLMKIVILGGDYFVNSTKTTVDNKAWALFKESLMSTKGI